MSNIPRARRLGRWFLINLFIAAVICGLTGRYTDPWLWGFLATLAALNLYPALSLDPELAKERFHPPNQGADRCSPSRHQDHGTRTHRRLLPGCALADHPGSEWSAAPRDRRGGGVAGAVLPRDDGQSILLGSDSHSGGRGPSMSSIQGLMPSSPGYAGMLPFMAIPSVWRSDRGWDLRSAPAVRCWACVECCSKTRS